ncbi:MAG: leucine-rich repeat domain-containing protein, partial [Ureaplasma sp.]|nr:leucine-rich repeat domain-containing protein [Ureaplasma sp.]
PTFSSNSINISLKSDVGLYKFKSESLQNISITVTEISLNSITLITPPTPSPVNWFTWDGTTITGLSNIGLNKTSIILPSITTGISNDAFNRNTTIQSVDMSLTKITEIPDRIVDNNIGTVTINGINYYTEGTFSYCSSLTSVILPPSIKKIGSFAFRSCGVLKDIKLPNTLETIGYYSFYQCSSFVNLDIPDSVKNIGRFSYYNCTKIVSVKLPKNIQVIEVATFSSNTKLSSIIIPDSVTSIDLRSFEYCSSLTSIKLPINLRIIGANAFYQSGLVSISFPENLSEIGDRAFSKCKNLSGQIILPNNIKTLGIEVFYDDVQITDVYIPNSLTSMKSFCFDYTDPSINGQASPIPGIVVYVSSNDTENLVKTYFRGTIINLNRT